MPTVHVNSVRNGLKDKKRYARNGHKVAVHKTLYLVQQAKHHSYVFRHFQYESVIFEDGKQKNTYAYRKKHGTELLFAIVVCQHQAAGIGCGRYGQQNNNAPAARVGVKIVVAKTQDKKMGGTTAACVPTQP